MRREDPRRVPLRRIAMWFAGALLLMAALVAAVLIAGRNDEAQTAGVPAVAAERDALLKGIPQDGLALGRADAPITLVEYADLQCPYCAEWARNAFPAVVGEYVRSGQVRLVFRGLSFIGLDSEKALRAALAAGSQDRLWDVVHALYDIQGAENAGWVTDDLLLSLGGPGLDAKRMVEESRSAAVERELQAATDAAQLAGVTGTPFFQAGPTGGTLQPLHAKALDAPSFRAELDRLLAD
jgi:protein-disulfide isomerase